MAAYFHKKSRYPKAAATRLRGRFIDRRTSPVDKRTLVE
jgi:hypothetical protein